MLLCIFLCGGAGGIHHISFPFCVVVQDFRLRVPISMCEVYVCQI